MADTLVLFDIHPSTGGGPITPAVITAPNATINVYKNKITTLITANVLINEVFSFLKEFITQTKLEIQKAAIISQELIPNPIPGF